LDELQALLSTHGLWIIALAVLVDQLGIPIPAPPTLLLGGSLIATGDLAAIPTLVAATLAALPSDLIWFELGRRRGARILRLLCRISLEPDSCVRSTRESFERRGPSTLLFAKFVPGLQTIAPPLAGASGMGRGRFLAYDLPGTVLWVGAFLVAGALLESQIHQFLAALDAIGARLGSFIAASIVVWIAWKFLHRRSFLRALRVARIDVDALRDLIEADAAPEIFDLRDRFSIESEGLRIPGARVIGLDELEARHHEIPRDREIVLYCT
jgi:membrane protein DedA with SNARE-associated domain